MGVAFAPGPAMPEWLTKALPFNRFIAYWQNQRMHFVDQGDGAPIILLHGNPAWSFLWRNIIPKLVEQGFRVIAPDLIGLGLSSKPARVSDYSIEMQVDALVNLIEGLKLENIAIVGHDWGGPIIAATAARTRRGIRAAAFMNTALSIPEHFTPTRFHQFARRPIVSDIAFRGFNFPVTHMYKVQGDPASVSVLAKRAYLYPFPSWGYRAGPLALARLVPDASNHRTDKALDEAKQWAADFNGPAALVWGTKDPILGTALKGIKTLFPNAEVIETDAGHFLQEEVPDKVAEAIARVAKTN